jgi:DnaK suppressor protein
LSGGKSMKKTEKKSLAKSVSKPVMKLNGIESTSENVMNYDMIRQSLLSQKSEILNRDSEFKTDQSQFSKFADEADQTALELQNNVSIQLHERERKSLLAIEKTLSKFTLGTYGDCECCGESIGYKRLLARPMAAMCIACMEDLEDLKSQPGSLFQ